MHHSEIQVSPDYCFKAVILLLHYGRIFRIQVLEKFFIKLTPPKVEFSPHLPLPVSEQPVVIRQVTGIASEALGMVWDISVIIEKISDWKHMLIKALVLQKNRTLLVILCYEFRGNLSTLQKLGFCFYYEEICAASHTHMAVAQDWKTPLRADRLMILSRLSLRWACLPETAGSELRVMAQYAEWVRGEAASERESSQRSADSGRSRDLWSPDVAAVTVLEESCHRVEKSMFLLCLPPVRLCKLLKEC